MSAAPLLSLAVIVRNESAALPALLGGHRDLWDEAVVVDTGSTDDSAAVARDCGARVGSFAWCDDFSAARNAALALCRGRWILVLDADEHIAAHDRRALREFAAAAAPAGCLLPQWNYVDDPGQPGWRPLAGADATEARGASGCVVAHQVRVFPGGTATRYEGRIHETVEPSLLAQGLVLLPVPWRVHHHGHRAGQAAVRGRLERNAALLALKLRENPGDPRARFEMAANLLARRQPALARRLLEHLVAESPEGPRTADAWHLLGRLAADEGHPAEAAAACRRAVSLRPDLADGWSELVRALCASGDLAGARVALDRFQWLFPADSRIPLLTTQVQAGSADTN